MADRLIELLVPPSAARLAAQLAEREGAAAVFTAPIDDDTVSIRALIRGTRAEQLLDAYETHFEHATGFRVIVTPVHATLPEPAREADAASDDNANAPDEQRESLRVARTELYNQIAKGAAVSWIFSMQTAIAAAVAAVGLVRNSSAIVIGAMVIAPLLGPHMALALATTLGDLKLARKAVAAALVGSTLTIGLAFVLGVVLVADPGTTEIATRISVVPSDALLGLAAGVAGALAFSTGAPASFIGVMVAVALAPPAVACGLMLGEGHYRPAAGAALLLATNVVAVNLAAVVTFALLGVRPRRWYEAETARRATRLSIAAWTIMLLATIAVIVLLGALDDAADLVGRPDALLEGDGSP